MNYSMLVLFALVAAIYGLPGQPRVVRQVWAFPDDEDTPRPMPPPRPPVQPPRQPAQPPRQPAQTPPTRRTTTTTQASQGGSTTTPAPGIVFQIPNCPCPAPPQYNPVCGTNGVTYVNRQKLNCASQCGTDVQFARLGVCATPRK